MRHLALYLAAGTIAAIVIAGAYLVAVALEVLRYGWED